MTVHQSKQSALINSQIATVCVNGQWHNEALNNVCGRRCGASDDVRDRAVRIRAEWRTMPPPWLPCHRHSFKRRAAGRSDRIRIYGLFEWEEIKLFMVNWNVSLLEYFAELNFQRACYSVFGIYSVRRY